MREYNICINGISARMKIPIDERYLLLLVRVQELFVVAFDFGRFCSPIRCPVAIMLASLLMRKGAIGFGGWFFGLGRPIFVV